MVIMQVYSPHCRKRVEFPRSHSCIPHCESHWRRGLSPRSSILIMIHIVQRELICSVYLCHHPLHLLKLLNRDLFIVPCYCSYILVPCLAFCVHFAGDLNQKISFVVGVLLRFTRTYSTEPGLPSAIKYSKPQLIRIRFDPRFNPVQAKFRIIQRWLFLA